MNSFNDLISKIRKEKDNIDIKEKQKLISDKEKRIKNDTKLFNEIFKSQLKILSEIGVTWDLDLVKLDMPNSGNVDVIFRYMDKTYRHYFFNWRGDYTSFGIKFPDEIILLVKDNLIGLYYSCT